MSRKAAKRDKRDRFTAEPSPELMEALDSISTQRCDGCDIPNGCPEYCRCEEPYLTTKDVQRVDLREPWKMPKDDGA